MPKRITILGAGIAGVATASYWKRDGHDVTIVDLLADASATSRVSRPATPVP